MTTPILPSGRPQGTGAGWGLVFAGYLAVVIMVLGHEPSPEAEPPPPGPRVRAQPVAQPEPAAEPEPEPEPAAEPEPPPPLFDEAEPEEAELEPEIEDAPDEVATCLDEVECILSDRPPACCQKYGKPPAPPEDDAVPAALDRDAILDAVGRVKSQIYACGERHPATGVVRLKVKVSARGRVSTVAVDQTPDRKLGACAATAMKRARFARTQRGGSFTFPFSF